MQYFRRCSLIRSTFRFISSFVVDVTPSTTEKQLQEINKLMKIYNTTPVPIRTVALFEWMLNIINLKPNFNCYLSIIRACGDLNNLNICQKIQQCIDNDERLKIHEYHQLLIKLIYMYSKLKQIELAEQIFLKAKSMKDVSIDISLYGTMFKGYNMNGQSKKTIELYENELLNNKTIEIDAIAATCLLSACSDCHRLDIGEYIHDEVLRLDLLNPPNLRLATAIMNMYSHCGAVDRAQQLFNELHPNVDHVAYSTLMNTYLSIKQPVKVLHLFQQVVSSYINTDTLLYSNVIHACTQLGLMHQAEYIHRSIPSHFIKRNVSLLFNLIDMHAHCLHLNEAHRLFNLVEQRNSQILASLLDGYAINGQGEKALQLFEEVKAELKFDEQVYRAILYACAYTGGLVDQAREIYKTIPDDCKTPRVMAAMVSIFARASLFNEVESFIQQHKSRSQNTSRLWSTAFMSCYHSKNVEYAKSIFDRIIDDPFLVLLFSDMTNSLPSDYILNDFRQRAPGICWTEIQNDDKTNYVLHEFHDNQLSEYSSLDSEFNVIINQLKTVDVQWKTFENDLKELFCGHTASRLAIAKHLASTPSETTIQLTKTKSTCHLCHDGMKQLSLLKKRDIILTDNIRVHHFHNGQCSCQDRY